MLMDEKLISTLGKILRLCNQNAEFDKELRKRLDMASSANALSLMLNVWNKSMNIALKKSLGNKPKSFIQRFRYHL